MTATKPTKPKNLNMELPILQVPGEINFLMQCGLTRDKVNIDIVDLNLKTLKDTAVNFIDRKFQDHGKNKLAERLMLFKHDYSIPSMLTAINVASDITDGSLVEIVLSSNEPSDEIQIRPHYLQVHSFKTPTFCDFCGELLFGLTRQGLKCDCSLVCHKRCAYKLPNDCPAAYFRRRRSSTHLMPSNSNEQITRTASSGASFSDTLSSLLPTSPNHQRRGSSSSEKGFFSSFTNHSSSISGIGGSNSQATTPTSAGPGLSSFLGTPQAYISGRPAWIERELAGRIRVPHTFLVHSYKKPTLCQYCKKLLKGFFRQGKQCKDCKYNVHKKCAEKVPMNCTGEAPKEYTAENELLLSVTDNGDGKSESGSEMVDSLNVSNKDEDSDGESENSGEANESVDDQTAKTPDEQLGIPNIQLCTDRLKGMSNNSKLYTEDEEASDLIGDMDGQKSNQASDTSANNIPLMRLVQSFKHTKRKDAKLIKEGWMIHYTNRDSIRRSQRKRHFWKLDSKSITLFQHDSSSNFYKEILISEILAIHTPDVQENYGFELLTKNLSYFCGEFNNSDTRQWENAIRAVYMPSLNENKELGKIPSNEKFEIQVPTGRNYDDRTKEKTTQSSPQITDLSAGPKSTGRFERAFEDGKIMMTNTGSKENDSLNSQQNDFDISLQYQIFPDEILGSGQFGIVYAGVHRTTGRAVAIKVIDKLRFPTKQEAQLKNEVSILQNIHHPGVVNLEKMFETKERIFVVMEKLHGDMLEMILSSERQRLTERCTKCLIYQILIALRYLHSKSIVHCDLKPENVLLSSDSDFPQVKLCDFGFARIIGEKSFRRSLVGTPAYLAPEVLRNKCYNRLLDMWSVGVIIYVSLSGTFPFNEDEDINDQIQNAVFMFPPNPWSEISENAIDLIKNLLQVKAKKRFTVDRALWHAWLENYETWLDLREMEIQTKQRWLTLEMDDNRWVAYATDKNLQLPTVRSTTPGIKQEESKFIFKTGRSSEPLSTIKDEKSSSSSKRDTSEVIEEHSEGNQSS